MELYLGILSLIFLIISAYAIYKMKEKKIFFLILLIFTIITMVWWETTSISYSIGGAIIPSFLGYGIIVSIKKYIRNLKDLKK